jgi:hypothetical protein
LQEPEPEPVSAASTPVQRTSTTDSAHSGSGTDALEREVKNMKTVMAQQTRQIATLAKTVQELTAEVKSLRSH